MMAAQQNRGLQFFITVVVFMLLFFGFYYFISTRDKKDGSANADFEVAFINDGSAFVSGIKAENPKKIAVAERVAWDLHEGGLYYIDNYSKLKHYDLATGDSKDVFISVGSFAVCPSADLIAVVEKGESGHLYIITTKGDKVADLGVGTMPAWFSEGERLVYINGDTIYEAAGGDWIPKPLYEGKQLNMAVSPDGKSILLTELNGGESRLAMLDIATRKVSVIKSAPLEGEPSAVAPLGFSSPKWLAGTNGALFVYNGAKGGRVYRLDSSTGTITGVAEEPGPIYSLAVSPKGDRAAYFYIFRENLPKFTEKVDGKEVPIVVGPADMTQGYIENLYKRGQKNEIGGEKLNNYNTRRLLDGDVIRIVDLTKGTYWPIGSGQYPVLK
jgi:hypothetical protein